MRTHTWYSAVTRRRLADQVIIPSSSSIYDQWTSICVGVMCMYYCSVYAYVMGCVQVHALLSLLSTPSSAPSISREPLALEPTSRPRTNGHLLTAPPRHKGLGLRASLLFCPRQRVPPMQCQVSRRGRMGGIAPQSNLTARETAYTVHQGLCPPHTEPNHPPPQERTPSSSCQISLPPLRHQIPPRVSLRTVSVPATGCDNGMGGGMGGEGWRSGLFAHLAEHWPSPAHMCLAT